MKRAVIILIILICSLVLPAETNARQYSARMSLPAIGFGIDISRFISGQISLSYLSNNYYFGARYYQYQETNWDLFANVGVYDPEEKMQGTSLLIGKAFSANEEKLLYIAFSTGLSYNITELETGDKIDGYRNLEYKETFGLPLDIFVSYPLTRHIALAANCNYNFNSVRDSYKGMIMIQLGNFTHYNYQP